MNRHCYHLIYYHHLTWWGKRERERKGGREGWREGGRGRREKEREEDGGRELSCTFLQVLYFLCFTFLYTIPLTPSFSFLSPSLPSLPLSLSLPPSLLPQVDIDGHPYPAKQQECILKHIRTAKSRSSSAHQRSEDTEDYDEYMRKHFAKFEEKERKTFQERNKRTAPPTATPINIRSTPSLLGEEVAAPTISDASNASPQDKRYVLFVSPTHWPHPPQRHWRSGWCDGEWRKRAEHSKHALVHCVLPWAGRGWGTGCY